MDAIIYFLFFEGIFEKVVAFEVLVAIGEDGRVLEVYCGRCAGVIIDDFVGGLCEKEVKMDVVFTGQVSVDWLCSGHEYFALPPRLLPPNSSLLIQFKDYQ